MYMDERYWQKANQTTCARATVHIQHSVLWYTHIQQYMYNSLISGAR